MSFKIEKITALMIIEVLGRPESYLKETLESLIKQINEEKGVKLNTKKINEPHHVKEEKDLFTSFAEIEVEVESPAILPVLVFKYMPSHIEVIEPENFIFKNLDFGEMLNEITRRLHKYEELVRIMQIQMQKQDKADPQSTSIEKNAEQPENKKENSKKNKEKTPKKSKK